MNSDKLTTVLGSVAVVAAGVISSGITVTGSALHTALISVGAIAGGLFAWLTNKPNPFKK